LKRADATWDGSRPIYRQLRDHVVAMMLEGELPEGAAIPSVRQAAAAYGLNPLTVLKAYRQLADEGLVEKRRGMGLYVARGATAAVMKDERARFLASEWPRIQATIQRLGLSVEALLSRGQEAGVSGSCP
jgi:GntR family transcriptional regulator